MQVYLIEVSRHWLTGWSERGTSLYKVLCTIFNGRIFVNPTLLEAKRHSQVKENIADRHQLEVMPMSRLVSPNPFDWSSEDQDDEVLIIMLCGFAQVQTTIPE